jgi:pyruvate/2-oxoglutarate dehydrogenase complex dihydrolipoamide acyltransferase (E2) component
MPKITVHGGPTVHVGGLAVTAAWGDSPDPETAGAVTEPPASTAPAPYTGGASSPGSSSETSTEKPQTSDEQSETAPRQRARMTASRSKRGRTDSSSAPGTDGDPTDDTSKA